jgi:hypothetical protein
MGFLALLNLLELAHEHPAFCERHICAYLQPGCALTYFPFAITSINVTGWLLDMLVLGDDIGAVEARDLGLVSRVIADDKFDAEIAAIAARVSGGAPLAALDEEEDELLLLDESELPDDPLLDDPELPDDDPLLPDEPELPLDPDELLLPLLDEPELPDDPLDDSPVEGAAEWQTQ